MDSRNNMTLVWPLLSTHFSSSEGCENEDKDEEGGGERPLPTYISSHFPEGSIGFATKKVEVDCYHSLRSVPLSASSVKCIAGHACAASLIDLTGADLVAADSEDGISQRSDSREHRCVNDLQRPVSKESPIFKIVGKVDGISKHIDASSSDPMHWHEYRVVVEIKNRMNKIPATPPLHDQIQLVTYMLMLGTTCGDLVQVVTRGNQSKAKGCRQEGCPSPPPYPLPAPPFVQSSSSASHSSHHISDHPPPTPSSLSSITPMAAPALKKPKLDMVQVLDFSVCRVLLNAPPYNHKDYFFSKVMPRLKVCACVLAYLCRKFSASCRVSLPKH